MATMADCLPLPDRRDSVIYADPPWEYRQHGTTAKSRGNAAKHYPTMPTEDICKLPVQEICGGGGSLFSMGDFPKHHRGDQGPGGVGVYIQNGCFRLDQDLRKKRASVLGHGGIHTRKCGGVPAGRVAGV